MFAACPPLWVLGVGSIRGFGCCGVAAELVVVTYIKCLGVSAVSWGLGLPGLGAAMVGGSSGAVARKFREGHS